MAKNRWTKEDTERGIAVTVNVFEYAMANWRRYHDIGLRDQAAYHSGLAHGFMLTAGNLLGKDNATVKQMKAAYDDEMVRYTEQQHETATEEGGEHRQ